MTPQLSRVLEALKTVTGFEPRDNGSGWIARCPAPGHGKGNGDHNPSFSVNVGSDDRVLMKCHAGCEPEQILNALNLTKRDLFASGQQRGDKTSRRSPQGGVLSLSQMQCFANRAAQYEQAITDAQVTHLAKQLGVNPESLRRLHVGFDGEAVTFPMRTPDDLVCGIRRRLPNGRKLSVKGGREGLFIPEALSDTGPLLVSEGPSDCAALLDLGFAVIGRPSCTGGREYVKQLARGRNVVIVGDLDAPGQRGAIALSQSLRCVCPSVSIIVPPPGLKDARAWIQAGATRRDIELTVSNGPIVRFAEPTRRTVGVSCLETG